MNVPTRDISPFLVYLFMITAGFGVYSSPLFYRLISSIFSLLAHCALSLPVRLELGCIVTLFSIKGRPVEETPVRLKSS
jgi:hypothetical protein